MFLMPAGADFTVQGILIVNKRQLIEVKVRKSSCLTFNV